MHGLDKVAHVSHVPGGFASVRSIGRPAFPAVDGYLAPGPASVGWAQGSAPSSSALDGWLSPQSSRSRLLSRPAHSATDGGGRRRFVGVASTSVANLCFSGLALGFVGRPLWLFWPGCPSRHEPARPQGFQNPADNFPNELARVCDSVGKSLAWRGLDTAFPSHFVVQCG